MKTQTQRSLCAGILNLAPRVLSYERMQLETHLKHLFDISWIEYAKLADVDRVECDVLLVLANDLEDKEFRSWLDSFEKHRSDPEKIWTPVMFFLPAHSLTGKSLIQRTFESNWYFDVISSDQIPSLGIRLANLLRIKEHILELKRYANEVRQLTERVEEVERDLIRFGAMKS